MNNLSNFKKNKKFFKNGPRVTVQSSHVEANKYMKIVMSYGIAYMVLYFMGGLLSELFRSLPFGEMIIDLIPSFIYGYLFVVAVIAIVQYPLINTIIFRKVKYDKWVVDKAADEILAYGLYLSGKEMFFEFDNDNVGEKDIEDFINSINEESEEFEYQFEQVDFSSAVLALRPKRIKAARKPKKSKEKPELEVEEELEVAEEIVANREDESEENNVTVEIQIHEEDTDVKAAPSPAIKINNGPKIPAKPSSDEEKPSTIKLKPKNLKININK